ncbi:MULTISPECIES: hypothetical protein [unclassified Ruegeria]|uniref:LuxE/PaaK family acyltransferase n=1 Tax=unclassified Ruegeria TaxID=2625375 RepID=UPI00148893A2|nr:MULTISPECIES: hypothetical protein [unclassified Ruegeria]
MNTLLDMPAYGPRDDTAFLAEMNRLTRFHINHCPEYARVFPGFTPTTKVEDLPFLHVSAFKNVLFQTQDGTIRHERVLNSSATSSNLSSQIALDRDSTALQAKSSRAILSDFIGEAEQPLIILDAKSALVQRGTVSARIAAGLALRPFATRLYFGLASQDHDSAVLWDHLRDALHSSDSVLVYGFTWVLWRIWADSDMPADLAERLRDVKVTYVHSGGWKKLESERVAPAALKDKLLGISGPGSQIIDYYGLVEQNGLLYPECVAGWRHVPVWADVLGRDPISHDVIYNTPAQLQLMNVTPRGAPYHSVLTEDQGEVRRDPCACGRSGRRFKLLGRLPKSETRGCANV